MRIARIFSLEQFLLAMVLMGTFSTFSGCGEGDKNATPAAAPQPAAEQQNEAEARAKAMQKK